jgi:hypothetical protein
MSEARRNNRAECSEEIRLKTAEFVVREKSKQGIKTSILAKRLGRSVTKKVYNDVSRLQCGDTSGVGLEYLLRLVEAVGYTVEINFVPKTTEASRRVAA